MSIKKYFEDKQSRNVKLIAHKSSEELLEENEFSHNFVISREKVLKRFIPRIDYSDPKNFAFFGNAERYYEDSIKRIYQTYPYDDSPQEKEDWFLSSSFIDLHIYNTEYPKSTGYAIFSPSGWSTASSTANRYGNPSSKEYVYIKGGPHVGTVYNESQNKESNLKLDGAKGNTVEFFLKKTEFVNSLTRKEVVFDCATNDSDISEFGSSYGRFRVELDGNAVGSPFLVTYSSGSNGVVHASVGSGITTATVADGKWHHYAVSVHNTGSNLEISLYVDGKINQTVLTGSTCAGNKVNMHANIGSLVASIKNGSSTDIGWGKLSGSLDEFRFWKVKRGPKNVGDNWRHQVAGGTSHEDINGDLGVYYKFNEGITTNTDTDKVVLDYSGRVSNGNWIGYASGARNTGSAIEDSGANVSEFKDPIMRSNHPSVRSLLKSKKEIGRSHDMLNSSALYNSFPLWMVQDDADPYKGDSKLAELVQILSSYFDTLYLQTKVIPGLKNKGYHDYSSPQHMSGSKPSPFSDKLLRSSGFIAPELFVESDVVERILGRDQSREYEQDLSDIKNLVYKNIYNNLVHIYKTKGTESSFRNIMRCFGIDDEMIKMNLYSTGYTYKFEDSYRYKSEKVKGINFNHPDRFSATIFQQTSSYGNLHYMSGNADMYTPYTFEADVIFPLKVEKDRTGYFVTTFSSSSIFGIHTPAETAGDTTFIASDPAGFQVYAVHHPSDEKAAKFVLTSSVGNVPSLTTGYYEDVYDDKHWNLSVRIRPESYPWSGQASSNAYTVEFSGYSYLLDELQDGFNLTGSATISQLGDFSQSRKSAYVGANRSNFNSTLLQSSDVTLNSFRAWRGYLQEEELKSHALSFHEYGRLHPSRNEFTFETGSNSTEISQVSTLMLHWDFSQVTGSDSLGAFFVADISRRPTGSFGGNNTALNFYHGGVGYGFPASSTDFVRGMSLPVAKENLPENVLNSSLVTIEDYDKERLTKDSKPINYYYAFEKSMYQTISEEMVKMFATIKEFNNLIGEPVNKYRPTYKKMDHLRSIFFSNVEADPDLDKYIEFYKWFDNSLGMMLEEVRPFSLPGSDGIKNMVESHVLERNKYQHRAPTLEFKQKDPEFTIAGVNELLYDYRHGHAPEPGYWANFDGVDDYIEVSDHNDFSFGDTLTDSPFSITSWVVFADPTSNQQTICGKYDANDDSEYLLFNNNGYMQFNIYDQNTPNRLQSKVNTLLEDGRLYNITVTYDGSGDSTGVNIYIDGELASQTRTDPGLYTAMHNTAVNFQIGSTVHGTLDFARNLHHVMVFDSELTSGQVSELYGLYDAGVLGVDNSSFTAYANIVSWWKMDRASYNAGVALDSIGSHHGTLNGDARIDHEYFIFQKQNKNCLWWKDRENRGDLLSTNLKVDANRETIRTRINTNVSGSTYAIRRLTRPYRFSAETERSFDVGSNMGSNKINDLYKGVIKFGSSSDVIELTASNLQDQVVCDDVFRPNQKERLHGKMDSLSTDGYLDADSDMIAPFSLYSSSLDSQPLETFKSNVVLTNNHSDSYHVDGSIPLQSIFTSKYVGNKDHRSVEVTVTSSLDRPEAYALEITAGKLKIVHQPAHRPRSMFFKNEFIKRPVNIRNIQTSTGSYSKVGNYSEIYEYVMTNGRRENNSDFAANDGYTGSAYDSVLSLADGILDRKKIERQKNTHVVVNRFSSPGGTEVMGDVNGGPNLDYSAGEYSVYNTMNHRNSLVRQAKNELDSEYSQKFGLRNFSSLVQDSYEIVSGSSNGFASGHKTNRNELTRYIVSSTQNLNTKAILFDGTNDYLEIDETRAIYKDNNEFSVFAWIKHSAADTAYQHTIWSHHSSTGVNREVFGIKGTSTNNGVTVGSLFFYQEGHSWQSLSSTRIDDGAWHLVGFTYEGTSNSVRLYVDGLAQPGSITISNISELVNDSNDKVSIGQEYDGGSTSDFFKGHMASVSIWGKMLTPNEVYELYSDGEYLGPHDLLTHTAKAHLQAWYRMGDGDNGSGTDDAYNGSIYDMSTNSYHAVPTNLASDAIKDVESELPGTISIYEEKVLRDNRFVTHPIPRNEIQYSWITSSATDTRSTFIGHKHDFAVARSVDSGYQREINFLTSSEFQIQESGDLNKYTRNYMGLNFFSLDYPSSDSIDVITSSIDLNTNTISHSYNSSWTNPVPWWMTVNKNGPHGWPTWKQIRGGEHRISKLHREQNLVSLHLRNSIPNGSPYIDYERPYNISSSITRQHDRVISNYQEPPVTSQYKPVRLLYGLMLPDRLGDLRRDALENGVPVSTRDVRIFDIVTSEVELRLSYANVMCKFANRDLMDVLELEDLEENNLDKILENMKKRNGILAPNAYIYGETIYPAEVNAYQKETRLRTAFVSKDWRETRALRVEPLTKSYTSEHSGLDYSYWHHQESTTGNVNSQDVAIYDSGSTGVLYLTQSRWPLDSRSDFSTRPEMLLSSSLSWEPSELQAYKLSSFGQIKDSGELQNGYSIFHQGPRGYLREDIPTAAIYNRRIPQIVDGKTYLAGESKWETGDQAGKYPFEKDYNTWAEQLKSAQEYSLVPEFRISEHIESMLESGNIRAPIENFLQITGSSLTSGDATFFKTYSNSDFMKYFSVVKESLEDVGSKPSSLFLKCSAMLKMLPYEGFYPATRTLKIAQIFQEEYTNHNFDILSVSPDATPRVQQSYKDYADSNVRTNLHLASKALYAPGVMYNSIKSGIAVDYPIFSNEGDGQWDQSDLFGFAVFSITASNPTSIGTMWTTTESGDPAYGTLFTGSYVNQTEDGSIPRLKGDVHRRVSFEDVLDPSNLAGTVLYDNEPHPSASYGMFAFSSNRRGLRYDCHPFYGVMFSGSTTGPYGSSTGYADNHWSEGGLPVATAGDTTKYSLAMHNFAAEVPNFFLKNGALTSVVSEPGPFFFNRDEIDQEFSMFVTLKNRNVSMYDNPSAFGPPVDNTDGDDKGYGFSPYVPAFLEKNSSPYVELTFTPRKRKYTLDEIQGEITSSFNIGNNAPRMSRYGTNKTAQMTLESSLNLFGKVAEPSVVADKDGNPFQIIDREEPRFRWSIQTKWETPVLNFNNSDVTLFAPTGTVGSVKLSEAFPENANSPWTGLSSDANTYLTGSRGMWHQYGQLPTDQQGYFLRITDPSKFQNKKSLASKVGFPVGVDYRVGELAETKEISEAVVAIPYFVSNNEFNFFELDPEDLREVLGEFDALAGQIALTPGVNPQIRHQIEMMQKYVFPPQLDFVKFRDKSPIAMYVFEFSHDLDKQDLSDLWQNLPAKIGQHAEGFVDKTVGHRLQKDGQVLDPLSGEIQEKMQWMVFKVKRRSEKNYFKKLEDSIFQSAGKEGDVFRNGRTQVFIDQLEQKFSRLDGYSYNWPYDYFSLVELIKVDAEVSFRNNEE